MGRFKINGLFFLKVRGFFDNDRGNLHYQTKPGKQLLHSPYTSYRNVNSVVVPKYLNSAKTVHGEGGLIMCSKALKKSTNIQIEKSAKCVQDTCL